MSVDFDFFCSVPLDKVKVRSRFGFMRGATVLQDSEDTLVARAAMPSGPVKVSFFGAIDIGRINDPLRTDDSVMLIASLEDLLATKLKTILDRAEAKDYVDISAMLSAGVSLERALGAFAKMYDNDPAQPLKAMGFFNDGDLRSLSPKDREILRVARDNVTDVPPVSLLDGLCPQGG